MAVEISATAAVVASDPVGRPTRITNMFDLDREAQLPPAVVKINCPPGYSHGAPNSSVGYATGPDSLPKETDE